MGQTLPMGKKREELGADLPDGELTHNPFAALRPKGAGSPAAGAGATKPAKPAKLTKPAKATREAPPASAAEKLVVRHESKGRGGKTVTRVSGFAPGAALQELAREARRALGAGVRAGEGELQVQGKQVERVASWLEGRGFPRVVRGN